MIRGLNHLTLAVRDLDRAVRFYEDGLGARLLLRWAGGAYLTLGDHWLCLSVEPSTEAGRDCTHAAFDVSEADSDAAVRRLRSAGVRTWKENASERDGHTLELHAGTLQTWLAAMECCL